MTDEKQPEPTAQINASDVANTVFWLGMLYGLLPDTQRQPIEKHIIESLAARLKDAMPSPAPLTSVEEANELDAIYRAAKGNDND